MRRELDEYTKIHQQRWMDILKNQENMKKTILKLLANPATEPEQLALAHRAFSSVCRTLQEASFLLDAYLRTGVKPTEEQRKRLEEIFGELRKIGNGQD